MERPLYVQQKCSVTPTKLFKTIEQPIYVQQKCSVTPMELFNIIENHYTCDENAPSHQWSYSTSLKNKHSIAKMLRHTDGVIQNH